MVIVSTVNVSSFCVLISKTDDVVPADNKQNKWIIDPFQMKGINGYLYGRGVSDNKGPVMAALYGVVDLVHEKEL